jgi:hypothetical protein
VCLSINNRSIFAGHFMIKNADVHCQFLLMYRGI